MSLWLLKISDGVTGPIIDGIRTALVEAANVGAARTAAVALDARLPADYFNGAAATEINSDTMTTAYDGGLFGRTELDNGVS